MTISIIHPSRGRADRAFKVAEDWISKAGCNVEYILSIDSDDPERKKYLTHKHSGLKRFITCVNENRSAIDAINKGAENTKGETLIVISDDFECPEGWGASILNIVMDTRDWIMKTPDGIQPWVITLPIMNRTYYKRFNYIYHPSYMHGWCDTEMTCVAELTGRLIYADIPFKHLHYSEGLSVKDEVNERADKHFEQGRKNYQERINKNFYLIDPPGRMSSNFYTRMKQC